MKLRTEEQFHKSNNRLFSPRSYERTGNNMNHESQSLDLCALLPVTKGNITESTTIPADQLIYHGDEKEREQWLQGIEKIRRQEEKGAFFDCEPMDRLGVSGSGEVLRLTQLLLQDEMVEELSKFFLGRKLPLDLMTVAGDVVVLPVNRKLPKTLLRKMVMVYFPSWEVRVCDCREHKWLDEFVHFWLPVWKKCA